MAMSETPKFRITMQLVAVIAGVAMLLAGWALYARFQQANEARRDSKATWHAVICTIEQGDIHNKNLTVEQKRASIKFFDGLLINQVGTVGCGYEVKLPRR